MIPYVNVYFYRPTNPDNALDSWKGCAVVPCVGDLVELGNRPHHSVWQVERVTLSKPDAEHGPQVADVIVKLVTPAS